MMRRAFATAVLLMIAGPAVPAAPPQTITVELRFDGGYAFIRNKKTGALRVASFRGGHHSDHVMRLRLDEGALQSGPSMDATANPGGPGWSFEGGNYVLEFPQAAATGVTLPSMGTKASDPCAPIDPSNANQMYLVPDITAMAKAAGSDGRIDPATLEDQVVLPGGDLKLMRATSCFSFRTGGKEQFRQRVTAGLGAVSVTFAINAPSLQVRLTNGSQVQMAQFAPAGGRIVLRVGRFVRCEGPACELPPGSVLPDFARFFAVFQKAPDIKKIPTAIKLSKEDAVSPGDECPPAFFEEDQ